MWAFCLHSLFREYGWQFLRHVALPHPLKTARAVIDSSRLDLSADSVSTFDGAAPSAFGGPGSVVGVGFCLKPIDPPCPSGRANHDCLYLERMQHREPTDLPAGCRECAIREMGDLALDAGAALYIMTSARDILFDLFKPGLDERRFTSGVFMLCRYSFQPFAAGLMASGIRGRLFAFENGDCRDYKTWLQADRGVKDDRTTTSEPTRQTVRALLANAAKSHRENRRFEKRGSVYHPRPNEEIATSLRSSQ